MLLHIWKWTDSITNFPRKITYSNSNSHNFGTDVSLFQILKNIKEWLIRSHNFAFHKRSFVKPIQEVGFHTMLVVPSCRDCCTQPPPPSFDSSYLFLPLFVSLLQTITPLIRCIGNISSGPEEYVAMAIQDGHLLPIISNLLTSEHRHVQKEVLWALSNMTGKTCFYGNMGCLLPRIFTWFFRIMLDSRLIHFDKSCDLQSPFFQPRFLMATRYNYFQYQPVSGILF